MAQKVLYVGDPDADGYSQVVFLEPVGAHGEDTVVKGVLVTPHVVAPQPIYGQFPEHEKVIGRTEEQQIPEVTVSLNGQKECLLAGQIAELYVGDQKVWARQSTKAASAES